MIRQRLKFMKNLVKNGMCRDDLHRMAASVAVGCFLFGIYRKMLGVLIADLIEKWYNSNVFCCIRYGGKYGSFI